MLQPFSPEVLVFLFDEGFSLESAALEVKLEKIPLRIYDSRRVLHDDHIHWLESVGLYGENPEDLGDQ